MYRLMVVVLLCAAMLLVVGCGSNDDKAGSSGATATTSEAYFARQGKALAAAGAAANYCLDSIQGNADPTKAGRAVDDAIEAYRAAESDAERQELRSALEDTRETLRGCDATDQASRLDTVLDAPTP